MPNGHDDHAWDYQEEIAQLTRRLEAMRSARANDIQYMQQLRTYVDRLRALLREVEWSATIQGDEDRCPICAASKDDGHKADCRLKAALEGHHENR